MSKQDDTNEAKGRFKKKDVIDAIIAAHGILAEAARELKCSRQTVYNYIERYPDVKDAYNEANERTKDYVEGRLMDLIRDGNVTAVIFYAKTKMKDRGYVERQELTGAEGADLAIDIKWADRALDE